MPSKKTKRASKGKGRTEKDNQAMGLESKLRGRLAEKEISLLASRGGLTVNRSEEDEQGWDMLFQFPASLAAKPFLDMQPASGSCFVQVKGFREFTGKVRIELSNALKLAKSPIPAFLVACLVPTDSIDKVWLIHCDATFVEQALKAAAEASDKRQKSLNKTLLIISLDPSAALTPAPDNIRNALAAAMGPDQAAYLKQKQEWISDVGYDGVRKQLVIASKATTDADWNELADFAVGLVDRVRVKRLELYDLRFGLERHEKSFDDPELICPQVPTGPSLEISVKTVSGEEIQIECSTHLARAVLPFLPKRFERAVLRANYLTFVARESSKLGGPYELSCSLNGFGESLPLMELHRAARAARCLRLIRQAGSVISLAGNEIATTGVGGPSNREAEELLQAVEDLAVLAPAMDLPSHYSFTVHDIARQAKRLRLLAMAGASETESSAVFAPEGVSEVPAIGQVCAVLLAPWVRFNRTTLVSVVSIAAPVEHSGKEPGKLEITATTLRRLNTRVSKNRTRIDMDAMYDEASATLTREGVETVFRPDKDGDLSSKLPSIEEPAAVLLLPTTDGTASRS